MTALAAINEALSASRQTPGSNIGETRGRLIAEVLLDVRLRALWTKAFDTCPAWIAKECRDDINDDRRPEDFEDGEKARFILSYAPTVGAAHLFTSEGWRVYLLNPKHEFTDSKVRLAFAEGPFSTEAFTVEPWTDAPAAADVREPAEPNPRRFVRCADGDFLAPSELAPWQLVGEPPSSTSVEFETWRVVACEFLTKALANELSKDASGPKAVLAGQPPRKVDFGKVDPKDVGAFDTLSTAVRWVYGSQHDQEIKHTFLTAELAREWPSALPFCAALPARLPNCLESARLLYKAHIRAGSRDTLKALADLRKVLGDEVQKISQQTRDLAGGVWKDVAIAIGTLSLKLLTDATRVPGFKAGAAYVGFAVAIYIAVSFWMAVRTNDQFLKVTRELRASWRTKLYGFLDNEDYKTLATGPLDQAEAAYASTKIWTTSIVAIVVLGLMAHSAWDLGWIEYKPN